MIRSNHAKKRIQQRGIDKLLPDLLLQYGVAVDRPGDAYELYIPKRRLAALINEYKGILSALEQAQHVSLILSDNGDVITAMHKH